MFTKILIVSIISILSFLISIGCNKQQDNRIDIAPSKNNVYVKTNQGLVVINFTSNKIIKTIDDFDWEGSAIAANDNFIYLSDLGHWNEFTGRIGGNLLYEIGLEKKRIKKYALPGVDSLVINNDTLFGLLEGEQLRFSFDIKRKKSKTYNKYKIKELEGFVKNNPIISNGTITLTDAKTKNNIATLKRGDSCEIIDSADSKNNQIAIITTKGEIKLIDKSKFAIVKTIKPQPKAGCVEKSFLYKGKLYYVEDDSTDEVISSKENYEPYAFKVLDLGHTAESKELELPYYPNSVISVKDSHYFSFVKPSERNFLLKVDTDSLEVEKKITIPRDSNDMIVINDKLYLISHKNKSIIIININNDTLMATIRLDATPLSIGTALPHIDQTMLGI